MSSEIGVNLTFAEIKNLKKEEFAKIIKEEIRNKAFEDLKKEKLKHSKMNNLEYKEFKIQNYFVDDRVESWMAKDIYKFRTRMADVNENFKNSFKYESLCPICKISKDDQSHLMVCHKLREFNPSLDVDKNYKDIFNDDCLKLYESARILIKALETRKKIIDKE